MQLLDFSEFLNEKQHPYMQGLSKSTQKKKTSQMKKQAKMDDDDPKAYKPLPGDSKKTKTSAYTKKFAQMFGESVNEKAIDNDSIETALKNKLEAIKNKNPDKYKKVTLPILREVMKRGMAAWKGGHRPGANQQQWGYARVNSFLTGGKTIGTSGNPGPDGDLGKRAGLI
jgi:hypothetical protein